MAPNPKPASPAAPAFHPHAAPPPPTPFPAAACGPHIAAAIAAVAARTQAASELAAHHLLTLASMAAQRLIGIRLPTGATRPVSTYFLTIAGSGEGRSAAENLCVGPVRFWQKRFWKDAHKHDYVFRHRGASGVAERANRYAGLCTRGGLFAGVAADLLTPSPARRAEAESLSALWDGIARPGADGAAAAPRLSVHLVAGVGEGLGLLRAPEAAESGLLGRILAAQPASRIGARLFSENDDAPPSALAALHARLTALYEREATCETRVIVLDEPARRAWLAFAQEAEAGMMEGGVFAPIRAAAGRLAEQAARLAAVIALVDDAELTELTPPMLDRGITLARFYADEALRLSNLRAPAAAENDPVAALQMWLERKYAGQEVSLREVYCFGPRQLRSAAVALGAMRQLELLGAAEPVKPPSAHPKAGRWRVPQVGAAATLQHTAAWLQQGRGGP